MYSVRMLVYVHVVYSVCFRTVYVYFVYNVISVQCMLVYVYAVYSVLLYEHLLAKTKTVVITFV